MTLCRDLLAKLYCVCHPPIQKYFIDGLRLYGHVSRLCVNEFPSFQGGKGLDGFACFPLSEAQFVEALQIQPKFSARAKDNERGAARCHP